MSLRQESLEKLRQAVKDKTLGIYKGATVCLYYDAQTDSRCAVGAIIPDKTIEKMKDGNGNCAKFIDYSKSNSVKSQLKGMKTYRGLTVDELVRLQEMHDDIIFGDYNYTIEEFEQYVASLK